MRKTTLQSRERVIRTTIRQGPDRVPFKRELAGDIYKRLQEHIKLLTEPEKSIGVWTNVTASMKLLDAMNIDIYSSGSNPPSNWNLPTTGDGLIFDERKFNLQKLNA